MPYKGAFNCEKCPRTSDPQAASACPAWWEIIAGNESGEEKILKDCAFKLMPMFLLETVKAANRSTAQICQARDAVLTEFKNASATETAVRLSIPGSAAGAVHGGRQAKTISGTIGAGSVDKELLRANREGSEREHSGFRDDGAEANTGPCTGADVFRHEPGNEGKADMAEQTEQRMGRLYRD